MSLLPLLPLIYRKRIIKEKEKLIPENEINKPKKIQVIVNCEESEKNKEELEKIGTLKYSLPMINSYVLEIYKEDISQLEGIKGVVKVVQDTHVTTQMDMAKQTIQANYKEESSSMGANVTVAILDTGLYPHNDFIKKNNRILAFKDFVNGIENSYDDNGHGTHVAGIIGGDGFESEGKYEGIAPLCNIVAVKVLGKNGTGNISDVLAGIQWVLDNKEKYEIKIMNLSVGMEDVEGESSVLIKAVDIAWDNDIVVVCAAGNNGPNKSTITTPGISRKVITVGSSDDAQTVSILDDLISNYSSRGPTKDCIKKPDIVAPGSNIISCNCNNSYSPQNGVYPMQNVGYIKKSGTSMAAPIITGVIARLLSDFPDLSNKDIKLSFKYVAQDLGFPQEQQGWGLINCKTLYEYIINAQVMP